jgi:hypothetical protein
MIFMYKLKESDKIEEFDLNKVMRLIAATEMWTFEDLDSGGLWDCECLDFRERKEGVFIIYDTVLGTIRRARLTFGVETIDEDILYNVSSERAK